MLIATLFALHANTTIKLDYYWQGFRREKDGIRGKFTGSDVVIFCYKFWKICAVEID